MKSKIVIIILLVINIILTTAILLKKPYDINRDGKVDIRDLLHLQKYLIEKGDDN